MQIFQVMRVGSVVLTSILLAKSRLSLAEIGVYETLLYLGTGSRPWTRRTPTRRSSPT